MDMALKAAISVTFKDLPWFILCCMPFVPLRKFERSAIAVRILLVSSLSFLIIYVGTLVLAGDNILLLNVIHMMTYPPMLLIFHRTFRAGWSKIFYVFLFEQSIATEVNLLSYFLTTEVLEKNPSVTNNLWQLFSSYLILLVVFPLSWFFLKGPIRQAMVILTEKQVKTLCVTPLIFFLMINYYTVAFQQSSLTEGHRILFSLFFTAIGISAYAVNVITTMSIVKKGKLELAMVSMEQQLMRQSDHFEQLNSSISQARQARHDLRHHLTVMRNYINEENYLGLKQYLEDYLTDVPKENEAPICRNFAVDVLISNYLALARQVGTKLDVKIDLPARVGIPDTQLCIVFGNLVENALHACQEQATGDKFIRIRCRTEGKQILLAMDNSTDRKEAIHPGVGLSSIEAVVERYQGSFEYQLEEGIFRASLLLCIP
ncbi:sensor histidine kinase [Candidatus Enterococcus ferrettii]|uniref:Sensor histidine kinase NatK-like C-terminal domain-containing protein n=1 Tax=Candidatus Enterococcus ferrettii TaxID=2815324 RepID=A0ABV0EQQ2_9ENTE|nr:GHKL domain-containing protein [Enterococcus sp. 665A]MBO1342894.1 sensor histidine kinase [Enterococcus sp. 665A]